MKENSTKPQIVIVTGGALGDWALPYLASGCMLVGADRGALFLIANGLVPDAALGDFDSVNEDERRLIRQKSIQYLDCDPVFKDVTDTQWAFEWAMSRQPASLLLLGATGSRFDHTFANVQLLKRAAEQGVPCRIVDACNEISLLRGRGSLSLAKGSYEQVSLLPLSGMVTGITLEGFLYPLTDAQLTIGQSLGISNVITEQTGTVRIEEGLLLVIQSLG
ncbi:MAG: thiamine pyrophosphokinae [Paenibacillaceae bacterium]|nr:thiamine pyrophosphokinae [Paenibacillaceae bacterium]